MKWKFFLDGQRIDEPIGWDGVEFTVQRLKSHGIDQPFSPELTFISKAAKILKDYFDNGFINNSVSFAIYSDVKNGQLEGKLEFAGIVDFSTYEESRVQNQTGWEIKVSLLEDVFQENFLSRQDVEVDLLSEKDLDENEIDPFDLETVRLHSQDLYLVARYKQLVSTFYDGENNSVFPTYIENSDFKGQFGISLDPVGLEYTDTNVIFNNATFNTRTLKIKDGRLKVRVYNQFFVSVATWFRLKLIVFNNTTNTISSTVTFESAFLDVGEEYTFDQTFSDYSITLPPNHSITFSITKDNITDVTYTAYFEFPDETFLELTELSKTYASVCQGNYIFEFLRRSIEIMTGDTDGLISDTFEIGTGCNWNYLLTTGLFIRNGQLIGQTNPQIKTSFKELFESLDSIFCLMWKFETVGNQTKIRIESREYAYNNEVIASSFSKVSDFKRFARFTEMVNAIKIGYTDKWKNIAVSGVFEIHTERNYFIPNKSRKDNSSSKLEILSKIQASGYMIEFLRRLQFLRDDSGSSDRPNDYDLAIIWVNRDEITISEIQGTGYDVRGEFGEVIFPSGKVSFGSNFIAESNSPIERIYNISITPARNAIRWWKWVGMFTYGLETSKAKLFFRVGDYYSDYSSRIGSESMPDECIEEDINSSMVLSESENISAEILKNPDYLLRPIGYEFTAPQSLCDFLTMGQKGNGLVQVDVNGYKFYGYIDSATNQPEDPSSGITKFTLLCANQLPAGDYDLSDYDSEDYF